MPRFWFGSTRPAVIGTACFAVTLGTTTLAAQAGHDGWYVAATFAAPVFNWPFPGNSGIFLVHPRQAGAPVRITGLPAPLNGSLAGGTWSMVRHPINDTLIVAELVAGGINPARIHEIALAGTAGTIRRTWTIGTTSDVTSVACLPDGRILIGANGMQTGPLAQWKLGILDPGTGGVTALRTTLTGAVESLTVDPSGTKAYVIVMNGAQGPGALYEVPLPAGTPALRIATFTGRPRAVVVDNTGDVLVTTHFAGGGVFRVRPTPPYTVTALPGATTGGRFAISIERATGNIVLGEGVAAQQAIAWKTATGAPSVLTTGPAGGWGTLKAIVCLDNPRIVRPRPAATPRYTWQVAPNPGGLPTLGNARFSLTWSAVGLPAPSSSLLAVASSSTLVTLPGLPPVLARPLVVIPVRGRTIPIGIPSSPTLLQAPAYCQMWHFASTGPASSEVLRVAVQ